jgi:selenocysteine-specific elongation factor
MALTVGTAGHIDHGKTWLVRALTGKDTDRLPEEQRARDLDRRSATRRSTSRRDAALADRRPGHERFVRTMVAGATGIDLFLLVIDAGEGARPQTHEHLAILRLLGIERGVVAVTKADAVDADTLELAVAEAQELVPGAEVVQVSAKTGAGLDELRAALARAAAAPAHGRDEPTRLYVDRAFTIAGAGTCRYRHALVGVDLGGRRAPGRAGWPADARPQRPGARRAGAARRGRPAGRGQPPGVSRSQLRRGEALVEPGAYPVSCRLDVVLEELEPVRPR